MFRIGPIEMMFIFLICLLLFVPVIISAILALRSRSQRKSGQVNGLACPFCNEPNVPGSKFCRNCGKELTPK